MATKSYDMVLLFPPIRTWDNPRNFPTGLGLVAARLRNAGYRVAVIDVNGLRLSDEEVLAEIERYDPKVVGIGGLITTYGWIKRMSHQIRQARPQSWIVLGGSVGTSIVETALRRLDVDAIAVAEADDTVLELMKALRANGPLEKVAGLAFLRDGQVVRTAKRALIENLDDLPFPAWEMFPMEAYLANPVVGVGRDMDIISSRGCPFSCEYCYRIFGRKFRGRGAEHVVGEIRALQRNYDIDFVSFQDDCFVVDKQRVHAICDLLDRKGMSRSLRWSCTGRVSVCDADMLKRMRASGCVSVSYGIESGSEKILEAMGKGVTLAQTKEAINNTRAVGMRCPVSFMIGYPGETRETVLETVEFCREMNIPLTSLMFTCPYPGTALYEKLFGANRSVDQEEKLVLKMGDAVDLTINLTEMSDKELTALRSEALDLAQQNYVPPSAEETAAQEKALYGEELYRKGQEQLADARMRAHRARHGFNESVGEVKGGGEAVAKPPGWVTSVVRPYAIAEAGVNHNGQLDMALKLVEAAVSAGADCVKFQAFSAAELCAKEAAKADYQKVHGGAGETQYDMLRRCELSEDDFAALKKHCEQQGIDMLVTPFSERWVKFLADLGLRALKVSSGSIRGATAFLDAVGRTHLPVIVSTGMADMSEVEETLNQLRMSGSGTLAVLQCVSLYPASLEQCNLGAIRALRQHTGVVTGFSDHTVEVETGALAVAAGAVILEKHFTLDKGLEGPDHHVSLLPSELRLYVEQARRAARAYGDGSKKPVRAERAIKEAVRMSVVAARFIKEGSVITGEMLTTKRPGTGIPADEMDCVIGSTARCDIEEDQVIKQKFISVNCGDC